MTTEQNDLIIGKQDKSFRLSRMKGKKVKKDDRISLATDELSTGKITVKDAISFINE